MSRLIGVYGASGFGREVMPDVRRAYRDDRIVFIDDSSDDTTINDVDLFHWDRFLSDSAQEKAVVIAIADSTVRERLIAKCEGVGIAPLETRGTNVSVMDEAQIGDHAILCSNVTITANVHIGRGFHANIYSYVAHDCVVGDYVTFAPRVSCNGNVHIGDHAYIGTGVIIRQGTPDKPLRIGRRAVVGMGSVVTKDVADGATVVGNPARPLIKD